MIYISENLALNGGVCPVCGKIYKPNGVGPSDLPELTTFLNELPSSSLLRYGAAFHDWAYHLGPAWGSRINADLLMYSKNEFIIKEKGKWWNRWFYNWANKRNYIAVREFGEPFWNKNGCKS